ncbi:uncharacterized protein LOC104682677 [Rhinopithecus roxellana]|uniref:uncharacterized protein LOC104682677 n=1 Tax=Rhinopithecus roxellana TaxID=61622 RepID=UPI0012371DEF|nr:uncharacterized protein LOC104682677 [Rhinopithecus roxellana]
MYIAVKRQYGLSPRCGMPYKLLSEDVFNITANNCNFNIAARGILPKLHQEHVCSNYTVAPIPECEELIVKFSPTGDHHYKTVPRTVKKCAALKKTPELILKTSRKESALRGVGSKGLEQAPGPPPPSAGRSIKDEDRILSPRDPRAHTRPGPPCSLPRTCKVSAAAHLGVTSQGYARRLRGPARLGSAGEAPDSSREWAFLRSLGLDDTQHEVVFPIFGGPPTPAAVLFSPTRAPGAGRRGARAAGACGEARPLAAKGGGGSRGRPPGQQRRRRRGLAMGGGGDERATAPAPPRPAYPRRRSARVRATAAAAPTSPRRGHGGRRRAGRLPPCFPVGVRFPGGGGRLGKRFRFKLGARVSAPDCGTSRLASGQRAWARPLGPARRGAAREDADGPTPPAAPALAAAPAPPRPVAAPSLCPGSRSAAAGRAGAARPRADVGLLPGAAPLSGARVPGDVVGSSVSGGPSPPGLCLFQSPGPDGKGPSAVCENAFGFCRDGDKFT